MIGLPIAIGSYNYPHFHLMDFLTDVKDCHNNSDNLTKSSQEIWYISACTVWGPVLKRHAAGNMTRTARR